MFPSLSDGATKRIIWMVQQNPERTKTV